MRFSAAGAPVVALVTSLKAAASTGPVPVDQGTPEPDNPLWPVPVAIGVVGALVALAVLARPGWRRPIAASLVFLVGSIAAFVLVAGGFFSDFSGNHAVYWQLVVAGVAVLVGGTYAAIRIARGGRRSSEAAVRA
jgi:hypothetical protein